MRIGSSILFSKQYCVQSYNWSCLRPLGQLQTVVDELDHFECDEIAIIRPVREHDLMQDFASDVSLLGKLKSMTPISFGGGIRSMKHLELIEGLPVERLILTSAFLSENEELLQHAVEHFGGQSVQCLLPFVMINNEPCVYHCSEDRLLPLASMNLDFVCKYANEVILHDCINEGSSDAFNFSILDHIGIDRSRLVVSGGVGQSTIQRGRDCKVASILIDNKTMHREYSVAGYKHAANM